MQPAIYAVEHVSSGKRLVCSTRCLSKRLWDQRHRLERREHPNQDLDADLKADGSEAFRILVLELVIDHRALPLRKRFYLERAQTAAGAYNAPEPPARKTVIVASDALRRNGAQEVLNRLDQLQRILADSPTEQIARVNALIDEVRVRLHP